MPVRTLHILGEAGNGKNSNEDGMALITALLIMLLCTIVVAGILQLATHTSQQSGLSRDRQGSLSAAQAGIQAELSLLANGSCPTTGGTVASATTLPDQNVPTESYVINVPSSCTVNGPAVISATGYVPNATTPSATTTVVAHINRSDGAPVSGGASGGYDFPDAIFTDGTLNASALDLFGSGGGIPNMTANKAITISGSQTAGSVTGASTVSISSAQIGGNVAAAGNLSLTSTTVTGTVSYAGTYSPSGSSVNGAVTSGYIAPQSRPLPIFTNASDIGTTLGVGSAVASCPSATGWTQGFYDILNSCAAGYAPAAFSTSASNGNQVIVVQGAFTVNVPPTSTGGQLYVVDAGGAGDSLTIVGNGSTLPVFAFTDGSLSLSGGVVGQFVGHSVTATGTTTFAAPGTPMPDLAFPVGYTAPTTLTATGASAFVSTVTLEYQCPGASAC